MKWHEISKVAKIVNRSRQAVYKRLTKLPIEEKISLGENLIEDGHKMLLSDEGIRRLFDVSTGDNLVDTPVDKKLSPSVNHEVVESLQSQLSSKEKEVVRVVDILDKVMSQLEDERRLRGEERQRTDTILMKLTTDISNLQKALEYKPSETPKAEPEKEIRIPSASQDRCADPRQIVPPPAVKSAPIQREVSAWESLKTSFDDIWGFAFGGG